MPRAPFSPSSVPASEAATASSSTCFLSSSDKAAAASLIRFRSISLCVSSESGLNSITESKRAKIGAPSLSRASSADA